MNSELIEQVPIERYDLPKGIVRDALGRTISIWNNPWDWQEYRYDQRFDLAHIVFHANATGTRIERKYNQEGCVTYLKVTKPNVEETSTYTYYRSNVGQIEPVETSTIIKKIGEQPPITIYIEFNPDGRFFTKRTENEDSHTIQFYNWRDIKIYYLTYDLHQKNWAWDGKKGYPHNMSLIKRAYYETLIKTGRVR